MRLGELSDCELALVYILERCNKYRYKSEQSKDSESLSHSETTESLPLILSFPKPFQQKRINSKAKNTSLKTKYWMSLEYKTLKAMNERSRKESMVLPDKTDEQKKGHQSGPALVCEQLEKLTLSSESEAECPECVILSDDSV